MIYGLRTRDFIENGPAATAIEARSAHSTRGWRALNSDHRLAAVETALRPANDFLDDDFPIAL
jgi:hypothetical protein